MQNHFVPEGVFQKAVIFDKKGKILLLQASDKYGKMAGTWDLPGGKVHDDETLSESIQREVKEETEISLDELQLFDVDVVKFHDGKTRIGLIYFAEFEGNINLSHEHSTYEWIDVNKIESKKFSFDNAPLWIKKAAEIRKAMGR